MKMKLGMPYSIVWALLWRSSRGLIVKRRIQCLFKPRHVTPSEAFSWTLLHCAALQRLNDYIFTLATWIRKGPGKQVAVKSRLTEFDQHYRKTNSPVANGTKVVSGLPPGGMKVVAAVADHRSKAQDRSGCRRSCNSSGRPISRAALQANPQTAATWLNGGISSLERVN